MNPSTLITTNTSVFFCEIVLDYWKLQIGNCMLKYKKDDRLDSIIDNKTTLPSHVGAVFW